MPCLNSQLQHIDLQKLGIIGEENCEKSVTQTIKYKKTIEFF